METAFVVGSLAWNTGLVAITGYLIKKWMDRQEAGVTQNREDTKKAADTLATELKDTVIEHRIELRKSSDQLNEGLKEIYTQLRIANGRTSKLEGGLETIRAICRERHGGA